MIEAINSKLKKLAYLVQGQGRYFDMTLEEQQVQFERLKAEIDAIAASLKDDDAAQLNPRINENFADPAPGDHTQELAQDVADG
jgi:hypothetical protein